MTQLTDKEIYRKIGQIVSQFELFKCYECAQAVMAWLAENGIEGKVLELTTPYRDEDYIVSDRWGSDGEHLNFAKTSARQVTIKNGNGFLYFANSLFITSGH